AWTLVQRTIWDPAQTSVLNTDYATWRTTTLGTAGTGTYRIAGDYLPLLQTTAEHMVKVTPRRADGADCQALYYIAEGDWEIRMDGATILNLNQPNVQVFMGDELSTTDLGPRASSCVNT